MPRTAITPQRVEVTGTAAVPEPANVDGNSVGFDAHRALVVRNGSAAAINVTFPTVGTVDGLAVPNRVVAVAAGAERVFRLSTLAVQPGGVVHVDYSAVASVTVYVLEL